jgi:hypothetical protein
VKEDLKAYFAEIGRRGGSASAAKKAAARSNRAKSGESAKAVHEMGPDEVVESLKPGNVARVPTAVLCQILGVSDVHLGKLATAGHAVRLARGQFDLWASVRSYVEFLTKKTESGRKPLQHTLVLAEAQIEEIRERRDRLAMLNAESRKELVPVRELAESLGRVCSRMRERIQSSNLCDADKDLLVDQLNFLQEGASADRIHEAPHP